MAMPTEARRRAEVDKIAELLDSAGAKFLDWQGQLFTTAKAVDAYVADAVAQAVRERDE